MFHLQHLQGQSGNADVVENCIYHLHRCASALLKSEAHLRKECVP